MELRAAIRATGSVRQFTDEPILAEPAADYSSALNSVKVTTIRCAVSVGRKFVREHATSDTLGVGTPNPTL
jgi:hypothetical protein